MRRTIFASMLLCSMALLWCNDLRLTEGLWYVSMPDNSGEIKASPSAFRLNPDGIAELVLDEKARRKQEEFRQQFKKNTGKELPTASYKWEWKEGQLKIHSEIPQNNFKRTDVYACLEGRNDILMPQNKRQFTLLARKGAKLSPEQAKQFFKDVEEANRDKFADNLKMPENVPLAEPEKELSNTHFFNHSHWRDAPENSFQQFVLTAIDKGAKLDDGAECRIPSLEKLLSTTENKACLLQYLACNSEWRLYRERGKTLHAVRFFRYPDGEIAPSLHQYYSHFLPTDAVKGGKVGDPALEFQFRFEIALDGAVWNSSVLSPRDKTTHRGNTWETRFRCGDALVNIYDQSQFPGRQMTAAALEYVEKEFAQLLENTGHWRALLPKDSFRIGNPELILRNGMQGGIYECSLWCNPGEKGTVYLKAFEITKGTPLSAQRLEMSSNCMSGWSDNSQEQFFSAMHFTIYEGDWNQFYGARFEIWFRPDSGGAERKLFEKNYKIQGWQR